MKYKFIYENRGNFRLGKMCQTLEVSRSGYHNYLKRRFSQSQLENMQILEEIRRIYDRHKGRYGSPRITQELRAKGLLYNKKRIARLMRINSIKAKTRKKFKVTTDSNHGLTVAKNLLGGNFNVTEKDKVWVSDITYIGTMEGWLYLAVIMDLSSRRVVGWSMSERIDQELVISALQKALINRKPAKGLIFHSDRGKQYASEKVKQLLEGNGILQSMSRKGNPYDNAVAESFFHTLKTELVNFEKYETRSEARRSIFEYLEIYYNKQRRHSAIKYYSPVEFENRKINLVA